NRLDHFRGGCRGNEFGEFVDEVREVVDRLGRPGRDAGGVVDAAQCLGEGDAFAGGQEFDGLLRASTDASFGHVEDTPQTDGVLGVGQHPEVGEDVPDLLAFVETNPADDLVQ